MIHVVTITPVGSIPFKGSPDNPLSIIIILFNVQRTGNVEVVIVVGCWESLFNNNNRTCSCYTSSSINNYIENIAVTRFNLTLIVFFIQPKPIEADIPKDIYKTVSTKPYCIEMIIPPAHFQQVIRSQDSPFKNSIIYCFDFTTACKPWYHFTFNC
ncbi:hypothetical protein ACTFIW_008163 [Dictyostelium discoideum]